MATIIYSRQIFPAPSLQSVVSQSGSYGMTRRAWLAWTATAALVAVGPTLAAAPIAVARAPDAADISLSALDAAVDTLIPADARTPSASALGVSRVLLAQAEAEALFKSWLVEGLKWFDQGVPGSFVLRDETARHQLMQRLADSEVGSQTRIFFEQLRFRTLGAYYADPRGRTGMTIERPPQPIGYPDWTGAA